MKAEVVRTGNLVGFSVSSFLQANNVKIVLLELGLYIVAAVPECLAVIGSDPK